MTILVIDVNGLKIANDKFGHAAGDELLRRAGEVLGKLVEEPCRVARIGGDEFAVLMPALSERDGEEMMSAISELVTLNNQYYSRTELAFAIGAATSRPGERLEAVVRRADAAMYVQKRAYYADSPRDRRDASSASRNTPAIPFEPPPPRN